MSVNKSYAVLGLGRYGRAVAGELVANGAEVMAVDINQDVVDDACDFLPTVKCADITDADVIEKLGIGNMDTAIISMASNLEASVMAIMLCKEAGVKTVIVKCANEMHKKIYEKIGADTVVFPESESGSRLAKNLLSSGFIEMVDLTSDVSLVELDVKEEWKGKTLAQLNLRKKYALNVVALRNGQKIDTFIDPNTALESGMKLIVIAQTSKLGKL